MLPGDQKYRSASHDFNGCHRNASLQEIPERLTRKSSKLQSHEEVAEKLNLVVTPDMPMDNNQPDNFHAMNSPKENRLQLANLSSYLAEKYGCCDILLDERSIRALKNPRTRLLNP